MAARAVMTMPDPPLALNNFGAILRLLGQLSDSVIPLLAARELEPRSPMILTNLAYSAHELGHDREAGSLFSDAIAADEGFGHALTGLGGIYMRRGDYEQALETTLKGSQLAFCAAAQQVGAGDARRRISSERQMLHLNLVYNHFKAIIDRATERALDITQYEQGWLEHQKVLDRFLKRVEAAATEAWLKAAQAALWSEASEFAREEFAKNKTAWAQYCAEAAAAIEDYWGLAQSVIDSIFDPSVHEYEETARQMKALGMIAQVAGTGAQLAMLPMVHSDFGWCGGTGVIPSDPGTVNMPVNVNKCPLKDGRKLAISLGPVEYKVDCTTVEIGFAFIGTGSLEWDFKQKRVTSIFVGVGGQTGAG